MLTMHGLFHWGNRGVIDHNVSARMECQLHAGMMLHIFQIAGEKSTDCRCRTRFTGRYRRRSDAFAHASFSHFHRSSERWCARYTFVSDHTHHDLTWLDHRIWRGSLLQAHRSYDGHLPWSELLNQHIGIQGSIQVLASWANPPRDVYCAGSDHYNGNQAGLASPLRVQLQRVPYRGDRIDRGVSMAEKIWTCKFRLGDEDVVTILRTVGSGEKLEFWGPSGYVPGLGLARERILRVAHPHLTARHFPASPSVAPKAASIPPSKSVRNESQMAPSVAPVAHAQRKSIVIDLGDSSSDDEGDDAPSSSASSPLSSVATFEHTDLTIPDPQPENSRLTSSEIDQESRLVSIRRGPRCPYCDYGRRKASPAHLATDMARHVEAAEKLRALGKMPQFCDACEMSFCTPTALAKHLCMPNTADQRLRCQYCSYQATQSSDLEKHKSASADLRRTGRLPERCEICGKTYCSGRDFAFHLCDVEGVIVSSSAVCADQADNESEAQDVHIDRGTDGYYHCRNCEYISKERANVARHMERGEKTRRSGQSTRSCISCRKSYCTDGALIHHRCERQDGKELADEPGTQAFEDRMIEAEMAADATWPELTKEDDDNAIIRQDAAGAYCCTDCDYKAPRPSIVRRHMELARKAFRAGHQGVRCNSCDSFYCTATTLSQHKCEFRHEANPSTRAEPLDMALMSNADIAFARDADGYHCCPKSTSGMDGEGMWSPTTLTLPGLGSDAEPDMTDLIEDGSSDQDLIVTMLDSNVIRYSVTWRLQRGLVGLASVVENVMIQRVITAADLEATKTHQEYDIAEKAYEGRYGCQYCDFSINDIEFATRHQELAQKLREAGVTPELCRVCDKKYCGRDTLRLHRCMPGFSQQLPGRKRRASPIRREGLRNKRLVLEYEESQTLNSRPVRADKSEKSDLVFTSTDSHFDYGPSVLNMVEGLFEKQIILRPGESTLQHGPLVDSLQQIYAQRDSLKMRALHIPQGHVFKGRWLLGVAAALIHMTDVEKAHKDVGHLHQCSLRKIQGEMLVFTLNQKQKLTSIVSRVEPAQSARQSDRKASNTDLAPDSEVAQRAPHAVVHPNAAPAMSTMNDVVELTPAEQSRLTLALSMRSDESNNVRMPFEDCETLSGLLNEIVDGPYHGLVDSKEAIRALWISASDEAEASKLYLRPSKQSSAESYRRFLGREWHFSDPRTANAAALAGLSPAGSRSEAYDPHVLRFQGSTLDLLEDFQTHVRMSDLFNLPAAFLEIQFHRGAAIRLDSVGCSTICTLEYSGRKTSLIASCIAARPDMASNNQSVDRFTALPLEMLRNIAGYLDLWNRLKLRTVFPKAQEEIVVDLIGDALKTVHVSPNSLSLANFDKITMTRFFRTRIENITYLPMVFCAKGYKGRRDNQIRSLEDFRKRHPALSRSESQRSFEIYQDLVHEYEDNDFDSLKQLQTAEKETSLRKQLTKAMKRLPNLSSVSISTCAQAQGINGKLVKELSLWLREDPPDRQTSHNLMSAAFTSFGERWYMAFVFIILDVLHTIKPLSNLAIGDSMKGQLIRDPKFQDAFEIGLLEQSLAQVTRLTISCAHGYNRDRKVTAERWYAIAAHSKKLQELTVYADDSDDDYYNDWLNVGDGVRAVDGFLSHGDYTQLKKLRIEGSQWTSGVDVKLFEQFLFLHRHVIKEIELESILLVDRPQKGSALTENHAYNNLRDFLLDTNWLKVITRFEMKLSRHDPSAQHLPQLAKDLNVPLKKDVWDFGEKWLENGAWRLEWRWRSGRQQRLQVRISNPTEGIMNERYSSIHDSTAILSFGPADRSEARTKDGSIFATQAERKGQNASIDFIHAKTQTSTQAYLDARVCDFRH
ncbi:uncharacterized protein MYCFIDRAFT_179917 [Pseudocercospora fijiensis CIRAD86]|uniref:C2H2-type domain-containing protein n=1 Tax=Pseudocercospora fijiensis (strain CIRAD86) TaxID=383855 RepID=M3AIQ4_PSEFD|nr:uncharacterized protein MYCFIDRAFT_179917 [Pseudocercospora fijiensis CIRAD86]EME77342.1 hypothetical protein MYCFIDRAFT_179917 [Pseudocercospora fijiensis CIRAD86]